MTRKYLVIKQFLENINRFLKELLLIDNAHWMVIL